jgi:membrane dipeptidase
VNPFHAPTVSARAADVYRRAIVIDMHNDLSSRILDDGYDPDVRHAPGFGRDLGETDLPRLVASGITAQFLAAFVHARYARTRPDQSWMRVGLHMDVIRAFVHRHPDELMLGTTGADARRAKVEGKVAIFIGVEGGHAIENSLDKLRQLYEQGTRYMTLTWNNGNEWAGSSMGEADSRTGGLTHFGRRVVREMNRLGMLVDVSHVSDATLADVLDTSTAPVIASHSSARAIDAHPRNLSDDMLRAIARTGGVVNVNFCSAFLDPAFAAEAERVRAATAADEAVAAVRVGSDAARVSAEHAAILATRLQAIPRPPLSALIDHVDHIARVAGVDHVGLGSDFDGVGGLLPDHMLDVTYLPNIAEALMDRGYPDADVQRMLGGNMLRVLDAVLDPGARRR